MLAKGLTPILNVSDMQRSFAWFEKLGWKKGWDWGDPPTFGGVCSGECQIFLCEGGQGGRGFHAHAVVAVGGAQGRALLKAVLLAIGPLELAGVSARTEEESRGRDHPPRV